MSIYEQFKTSPELEQKGILIDYGTFRVRVARAGGSNKRFLKLLEAKIKPYRRALATETMDNDRGMELLREVYAEAVVISWETKVGDEFKSGIEAPDGKLLPFSKENVLLTFNNLPDLFNDIKEQADKAALFREKIREEEGKN